MEPPKGKTLMVRTIVEIYAPEEMLTGGSTELMDNVEDALDEAVATAARHVVSKFGDGKLSWRSR